MTRPIASNGLGFTISMACQEVEKIERIFALLPDTPGTYAEWKRLVIKYNVIGVKVHDAKLAAIMNVHNIDRLLTFNGGDFVRFGIQVLNPTSV